MMLVVTCILGRGDKAHHRRHLPPSSPHLIGYNRRTNFHVLAIHVAGLQRCCHFPTMFSRNFRKFYVVPSAQCTLECTNFHYPQVPMYTPVYISNQTGEFQPIWCELCWRIGTISILTRKIYWWNGVWRSNTLPYFFRLEYFCAP